MKMKTRLFFILTLLIISSISIFPVFAQYPAHTQFSLPNGAKARLGKGAVTANIMYSPDGALLAVAGSIGIWLYDAETYQEIALLTGHTDRVLSVAFSPDGSTLASVSADNTIRFWDAASSDPLHRLTGHASSVYSVAFSPDGSTHWRV